MSEVISSFKRLIAGSHVFALLTVFLSVILHTMWLGKSLQLLCIMPFGMLCLLLLFAFQSMFISIWVSRLEIAEFPDSVRRSAP